MAVYDKTLNKSVTAVIYQECRLWTQLCSIAKIPVAGWSFGHKSDVHWVDNYVVVYIVYKARLECFFTIGIFFGFGIWLYHNSVRFIMYH